MVWDEREIKIAEVTSCETALYRLYLYKPYNWGGKKDALRENTCPLTLQLISISIKQLKPAVTRKRSRRRIRSNFSSLLMNCSTLNVLQLYQNMILSRLLPKVLWSFSNLKLSTSGLSVQHVPRFNVHLTAKSCRSSLTDFERVSDNDLKNIILSAKPKSCSLDPLPTWLLILVVTITSVKNLSLEKGFFLLISRSLLSVLLSRKKLLIPMSLVTTGLFLIFRSCQRHLKESSPLKSMKILACVASVSVRFRQMVETKTF